MAPRAKDRHNRFDFVLFQDGEEEGFAGLAVGRVRLIFSFFFRGEKHEVVAVEEYRKSGRDKASGLWKLRGVTKKQDGQTVASLRILPTSTLLCAAHVVPDWNKVGRDAQRWTLFDEPGCCAYLNHFATPDLYELVEDTCLSPV